MNTIKKEVEQIIDSSGNEWSQEMMEKVYVRILYKIADKLSDVDVSLIEKLDNEENGDEKIYAFIQQKKLGLEAIIREEIESVKALKPY